MIANSLYTKGNFKSYFKNKISVDFENNVFKQYLPIPGGVKALLYNQTSYCLNLIDPSQPLGPYLGDLPVMSNQPQYLIKRVAIVSPTTLISTLYPVGSIWVGSDDESKDPNVLFGGKWVRIKDQFLYSSPYRSIGQAYNKEEETGSGTGSISYTSLYVWQRTA